MTVNRTGKIPIYLQIAYHIRDDIVNGVYKKDAQIPIEKELASQFGVSRMTARNAVTYLVDKGFVYRVHGKGAFVATDKLKKPLNALQSFHKDMEGLGVKSSTRMLDFQTRLPSQKEQQLLDIRKSDKVFNVKRMRYANGEPLGIQTMVVPTHFIPHLKEIDLERKSFYRSLKEAGHPLDYAEQRIETVLAPDIAEQINISSTKPFLFLERVSFTKEHVPVELLQSFFNGEKYSVHVKLYSD